MGRAIIIVVYVHDVRWGRGCVCHSVLVEVKKTTWWYLVVSVFPFTSLWVLGINKVIRISVASTLFVVPYHRLQQDFFKCACIWRGAQLSEATLASLFSPSIWALNSGPQGFQIKWFYLLSHLVGPASYNSNACCPVGCQYMCAMLNCIFFYIWLPQTISSII